MDLKTYGAEGKMVAVIWGISIIHSMLGVMKDKILFFLQKCFTLTSLLYGKAVAELSTAVTMQNCLLMEVL